MTAVSKKLEFIIPDYTRSWYVDGQFGPHRRNADSSHETHGPTNVISRSHASYGATLLHTNLSAEKGEESGKQEQIYLQARATGQLVHQPNMWATVQIF